MFFSNSFSAKSNMHPIRAKLRQDRFWPTSKRNQETYNHCLWKSCMKKLRMTSVFLVFLLIKQTYTTLVDNYQKFSFNKLNFNRSKHRDKEECFSGWPEHRTEHHYMGSGILCTLEAWQQARQAHKSTQRGRKQVFSLTVASISIIINLE